LTLVHRRAVDLVRREQRRQTEPITDETPLPAADERTDEAAWLRFERERVQKGLGQLPDVQREVLELAYYGGYSQAELAERLGVSLDALRKLRRDPGFVTELSDAVLEALRDQLPDLTGKYIQAVGAAEGEKLRGLLEQMGVLRPAQDDKPKIIIGVDPDRI
jgi:transcriptional regulator with XRE-family HTH domain